MKRLQGNPRRTRKATLKGIREKERECKKLSLAKRVNVTGDAVRLEQENINWIWTVFLTVSCRVAIIVGRQGVLSASLVNSTPMVSYRRVSLDHFSSHGV